MRILLLVFLATSAFAQEGNEKKIRNDYAVQFAAREHAAYKKIAEGLRKQPYFLGDSFENPTEFRITREDCADFISMDDDMFVNVPVGTSIRLTGEITIGVRKFYEIRVELSDNQVLRSYLESQQLDDLFFPENSSHRALFFDSFHLRDREIRQGLMKKYKVSEDRLSSILSNME